MDEKKVTVLKRTEDGKVKSLLIFNEANEQARLYFSDDEKLTRMVIGNGSRNLVAFDRVGDRYIPDPLTPGEKEEGARWAFNGTNKRLQLYLKDPSGRNVECIDSETHKPNGQARCFLSAEGWGIAVTGADGFSSLEVYLEDSGRFEKMKPYGPNRPCEIIEQNTITKTSDKQQTESLVQRAMNNRLSR